MKRVIIFSFLLFLIFLSFSCSKQTNSYSSNYDESYSEYVTQTEANAVSKLGKNLITTFGTVGGILVGFGIGFGIAFVICIFLPAFRDGRRFMKGPHIALASFVGIVTGGIVAVVGGAFSGVQTYAHTNGEVSEYINVETHLNYVNDTTNQNMPFVFGGNGQKNYATPTFAKKDKVKLAIEMYANMIPERIKKASERQKSLDLRIPVEIQIDKNNIEDGTLSIAYSGGSLPEDAVNVPEIVDGIQHYHFFIKNDPNAIPSVVLKFVPAGIGEAKLRVIYGKPNNKLVLDSCNINQIIEFTE